MGWMRLHAVARHAHKAMAPRVKAGSTLALFGCRLAYRVADFCFRRYLAAVRKAAKHP